MKTNTKDPRQAKLAIMLDTIAIPGSVAERFQAARAAGFDGVEVGSHLNQEEVLAAAAATSLAIPSVCCSTHWPKPLSDPDLAVRAAGLAGLKQALRDAARYGAQSVLLVPAIVTKQVSYAEAYRRSQVEIRKALPLAARLRVRIAVENVWNGFLLSPLEAARYVDEFASPWVGFHFDVGNIVNYGWPEQWLRILGRRIVAIHMKEYSRARRDKRGPGAGFDVPFLEGDNDWPAVMRAVDEIGYRGWFITEQGGARTLSALRDQARRARRILAL